MTDLALNNTVVTISNTPGTTDNFVIAGPATRSDGLPVRDLTAAHNGKSFTITAYDAAGDEQRTGCVYTHATRTLTRGTLEDSSTGSAINLTSAAVVTVTITAGMGNSLDMVMRSHIGGLLITKGTGNTINISAGTAYVPASDRVLSFAGVTSASAGALGVSQWHQVYLYDNAGTVSLEVVNNANPPSTPYVGTARQGGTNSNRRWIGCFRTDASSNVVAYEVMAEGASYSAYAIGAPIRVLNNGVATTVTQVSIASAVPKYAAVAAYATAYITALNTGGNALNLSTGASGSSVIELNVPQMPVNGTLLSLRVDMQIDAATPSVSYKVFSASGGGYIDVSGYRVAR